MTPPRRTTDEIAASPSLAARFRSPALELLDGREYRQPLPSATVVAAVVALASAFDAEPYGLRVGVREQVIAPPRDLLRPEVSLLHAGAPRCAPAATPAALVALAVLVVERSDDAHERLVRYAASGLAEVWVLALEDGVGAAYGAPVDRRFRRRSLLLPGEPYAPEALPWARVVPLRPRRERDEAAHAPQPSSASSPSSSSSISKRSPSTSMTSPGATRRFRRVSG